MIYFVTAGAFFTSLLLFIILLNWVFKRRIDARYRLSQLGKLYNDDESDSIRHRPSLKKISALILKSIKNMKLKLLPNSIHTKIETKLSTANYHLSHGTKEWIGIQATFYIILPSIFLLYIRFTPQSLNIKILLSITFISISLLLPTIILKGRRKSRISRVTRQLPYILDLLTVSIEAGLSFDSALGLVLQKAKGKLVLELSTVLHEMQLGTPRREALNNFANRCNTSDIVIFASSINQAEQLGMSIGNVLRIQSDQLRDKRRQLAREQAMKIPIKMLFPLIFFIFPTIFIVILGPALIRLSQFFLN